MMNSTVQFFITAATMILISSFTSQNDNAFIGTYCVSTSDPAQIKLTINSDHTFYYQDFSVPGKKIVVNSNWTQSGKKVFLNNPDSDIKFHDVWTFVANGQVAKSHKGLLFYRLEKIDRS